LILKQSKSLFQIAHHHHHVPVPVPVPTYYDHSHDTLDGFTDYAHPHIQYRKDLEELKEWGIEPQNEPYEESSQTLTRVVPAPTSVSGVTYSGPYGLAQYAPNVKPIASSSYLDNSMAASAHNLVYSGYRRPAAQPNSAAILSVNPGFVSGAKTPMKNSYAIFAPNIRPIHPNQAQRFLTPAPSSPMSISRKDIEDEYYGPIIDRLEKIFGQLRFYEETCREMLVCSMYKNPVGYSPHSNLVSNELSRYKTNSNYVAYRLNRTTIVLQRERWRSPARSESTLIGSSWFLSLSRSLSFLCFFLFFISFFLPFFNT